MENNQNSTNIKKTENDLKSKFKNTKNVISGDIITFYTCTWQLIRIINQTKIIVLLCAVNLRLKIMKNGKMYVKWIKR